jgi:hypothetical protein
MQADIAIVVAVYNRPVSMRRLLQSLENANYHTYQNISLIISIDYSGNETCSSIAHSFEWEYGQKQIIVHTEKLGLKKHILSCGDLSERYDAVIVLEDDLLVSPEFYDYTQQAYQFYKQESNVAGIALYRPSLNEIMYCPFEPIHDGYDNFFMQVPCSWGQMWTREQWAKFRRFLNKEEGIQNNYHIPGTVQQWPNASSWKKIFYAYLSKEDHYFVYPRIGLSTNFADTGENFITQQNSYQAPLLIAPKSYFFSTLEHSLSIYDAYFELKTLIYHRWFKESVSVSFDLNGTKSLSTISTEYLISCKKSKVPEKTFPASCYPYELNVLLGIETKKGTAAYFTFAKTDSFSEENQFMRLNEDVKRIFMSHDFIKNAAMFELKKQKEFRIGDAILRPFRFFKNLLSLNIE